MSTVIKIRRLAKDAALAAFAASKPGRPRSLFEVELEAEERARHLALATREPDEAVAQALVVSGPYAGSHLRLAWRLFPVDPYREFAFAGTLTIF